MDGDVSGNKKADQSGPLQIPVADLAIKPLFGSL